MENSNQLGHYETHSGRSVFDRMVKSPIGHTVALVGAVLSANISVANAQNTSTSCDKLPTPMEQAMCEVQLSRGQAANRATEAANQAAEANRQKLAAGAERDAIRAQVAAMKDAIDVARSLRGN